MTDKGQWRHRLEITYPNDVSLFVVVFLISCLSLATGKWIDNRVDHAIDKWREGAQIISLPMGVDVTSFTIDGRFKECPPKP